MTPQRHPAVDRLPPDFGTFVASPRSADGGFRNPWGAAPARPFTDVARWKLVTPNPFRADKRDRSPRIPRMADPGGAWSAATEGARVQWLGHAAIRVDIDGVVVVIDPTFGRIGPGTGMPRVTPAPLIPDALGRVDVVALTHGHYDHLDAKSLRALHRGNPEVVFFVPKGLERFVPRGASVVAFDWWESVSFRGVEVCFVPAQHWHRRTLADTNRALWGGWVVKGGRSVYHSGDTGFFGGFGAIGAVFPNLDAAVLPLGAYEPRWFMGDQHMPPEASVQALLDLGARRMVGMHWGTFDLTDEPLDHGAFTLLPEALLDRAMTPDMAVVLAHGGVMDLGTGEAHGLA
jgi:L-ascorbate metabolism protein UlaG (beta-lactamase superfamily)